MNDFYSFLIFYSLVGFIINLAVALINLYKGYDGDYVILPQPFIWFLTIWSWPKTLWDLIAGFNKKDDDIAS